MIRDFAFSSELGAEIARNLACFEPLQLEVGSLRHAAVGVVVVSDDAEQACCVLTRRLSTLRRHAGQWALPGGRLEPGEDVQTAALREIHEEIGLELSPAAVLGRLDDYITRSGHLISTLVLWAPLHAALLVNPDEVDAVFRVPLSELDHAQALRMKPLLHFSLPSLNTTVHAPTAALLYQFREVALHRRKVRIGDIEQPFFAWR